MGRKSVHEQAIEPEKVAPSLAIGGPRPAAPGRSASQTAEHSQTAPVFAVIGRAADMGLMTANTHQVGARLPVELLAQAKKRTGIASTTELLAFALANVAVEDNFAKAFVAARGKLDPDLDLGF